MNFVGLKPGSKGEEVGLLHKILLALGFELDPDEVRKFHYGETTQRALGRFQKSYELEVSPQIDARTSKVLEMAYFYLFDKEGQQVRFAIGGRVLDETGKPVNRASVELWALLVKNKAVSLNKSALTNDSGNFSIKIASEEFAEVIRAGLQRVFFRVLLAEKVVADTRDTVSWDPREGRREVEIVISASAGGEERWVIQGVIRDAVQSPAAGLRVVVRDNKSGLTLGQDTTNVNGAFQVTFTSGIFVGHDVSGGYRPDVCFHIFAGDKLLLDTADQPMVQLPPGSHQTDLQVTLPGQGEPVVGQLSGRVFLDNRLPAANMELNFYRKGFGGDTLLKTVKTDARGFYRMDYQVDGAPLTYDVRAIDQKGEEILLTNTRFSVEAREVRHLVAPAAVQVPTPEYQRLMADIRPQLGGRNLREARENEQRADLSYLFQQTGWDARLIGTAALADRRSTETGMPADMLYALFRMGVPSGRDQLARVGTAGIEKALQRARQAGIAQVDVEAGKKAYQAFALQTLRGETTTGGLASINDFFARADISSADQDRMAQVFLNEEWSEGQLWEKARRAGVSDGAISRLQTQGKLAFLTLNNPQLSATLENQLDGGDLAALTDMGYYKAETWKNTLTELAGDDPDELARAIPAAFSSDDPQVRLDAYAADLARKVRAAYPTHTLAAMVGNDELILGQTHQEVKSPVQTLLRNTAQLETEFGQRYVPGGMSFNALYRDHQEAMLSGIPENSVGKTVESAKKLTRLYQMAPTDESMQVLYDLGINSAFDVIAYPYQDWMQFYAPKFKTRLEAEIIYRKSEQTTSVIYNFYTAAEQLNTAPLLPVSSPAATQVESVKNELIKRFPTLETLFGSLDFCECEHCRSVLSPAAYLVDILRFLDPDQPAWDRSLALWKERHNNEDYPGEKAYKVLTDRRPDLPYIQLTCENTHTALPYIDIVNEVLECYVDKEHLDASVAYDTGEATSEELLAEPRHIRPGAYDKLQEAVFPLALPFDLSLEMVRQFCGHFDIPYWKLLHTFRNSDSLLADGGTAPYFMNDIFIEQLGLSATAYTLFTEPDLTNWFRLYGYPTEAAALSVAVDADTLQRIDLLSAKNLSRRLGVTYTELVALVKTRFINPALEELVILRTLGISTGDVYRWKAAAGYTPFDPDELAAFEARLAAASTPDFSAADWLNQFWNGAAFDRIIVVFDTETGCNFDEATLRFADGDALTALEWTKLNLLVRLWKALGWKLEEVDAALVSFMPADAPLNAANLGEKLRSALICLSHLKQLHSQYKLGKYSLQNWTALWGDLTLGEQSVYRRHFLTYSILKEDPIFDHPLGRYLEFENAGLFEPYTWDPEQPEDASLGNVGLINHLPAVQAALVLTEEEIGLLLETMGLTIATAPLNLAVLHHLYGFKVLRDASKLSVREILSLQQLSGLEPGRALEPAPITTLEQDYPYTHTLRFLELAARIKAAGFSMEDLDYLLRHEFDPVGPYRVSEAETVNLMRSLSQEIQRIYNEYSAPPDAAGFTDEFLQEKLLQALSPEVAATFISMWNGSLSRSTSGPVPPAARLPEGLLAGEPGVAFSYDDIREIQSLTFTGVLDNDRLAAFQTALNNLAALPGGDPDKISAAQRDLATALLTTIRDETQRYYEEHIFKPIFREDAAGAFSPFFPVVDTSLSEQAQLKMKAARQEALGRATLEFLKEKFVRELLVRSLSDSLGLEVPFMRFLLQDSQVLSVDGKPLHDLFAQANSQGVSISFIDDVGTGALAGPVVRSAEARVAAADVPAGVDLIRIEGYLECREAQAYRFYVQGGNQNTIVDFSLAHMAAPLLLETLATDGAEVSAFAELEANVPYRFSLSIRNFSSGAVSLSVQSRSLPKGNLNQLRLYPQQLATELQTAKLRLEKSIQLIQEFGLTADEVRYLSVYPGHYHQFSFNALPTVHLDVTIPAGRAIIRDLFARFLRLADYGRLRTGLAGNSDELIPLLERVADDLPPTLQTLNEGLGKLTRRKPGMLQALFDHFGFSALDAVESDALARVWEALGPLLVLGVPAAAVANATSVVSKTLTHADRYPLAAAFKQTVKARYSADNWNRIAQSIYDRLRPLQRDALVAYVMHKDGFERREQLFEYFLIDPGMEPVVQTSRIRLAISSVQTFVQRCLLNLEPQVSPFMINRNHWEWMKRYRVWEANRKIFLFPENWLEPEFRDDKTHLFQDLEGAVLQGDTNADIVERAFYDYLKGLQKIARLNMVAMYCEEDPINPAGNTVHVIGKVFTQPEYFYRSYRNNMWTPWAPIPAQIEGEHLALIKWRDRLHIFWVTFMRQAESNAGDNESIENASTKSKTQLMNHKVEVQLNWCEYFQGEWQARETGGFENSLVAVVTASFDPAKVYIHASIEYDSDGNERAVRVHLSGSGSNGINRAFRLVSKLANPKSSAAYLNNPAAPPYSFSSRGKTKYRSADPRLRVTYKEKITTIENTVNGVPDGVSVNVVSKTANLIQVAGSFEFMFCNDPIIISGDKEIDSLISPFFVEDDEHSITLFAEPEFFEKTTVTWEEWIIKEKTRPSIFVLDDYYETIPVKPFIPYEVYLEFEDYIDPGVIDPIIRGGLDAVINPVDDWLINPGTAMQFDDQVIGPRGGLTITPAETALAGGAGAPASGAQGTLVTVAAGSEVAAGETLFIRENPSVAQGNRFGFQGRQLGTELTTMNIVGQNGVNGATLDQFGQIAAGLIAGAGL